MKEMPERIYLFDCNDAITTPLEGDTEYIRKDIVDDMIKIAEAHAFFAGSEHAREEVIEKAISFLENDVCCYIVAQDFAIEHERLEKDFRKFMEEQV